MTENTIIATHPVPPPGGRTSKLRPSLTYRVGSFVPALARPRDTMYPIRMKVA